MEASLYSSLTEANRGIVVAVHRSPEHAFSKQEGPSIALIAGVGVAGDAHAGRTVQHRSRLPRHRDAANLRQVHLIHGELHDELATAGFVVEPGQMGENVTTRGIDLLGLPSGAQLRVGPEAVLEVTGLRNPCEQLNGLQPGLMQATLGRDGEGRLVRKAGIMAVVLQGGEVHPGDPIVVDLPAGPHVPLVPV